MPVDHYENFPVASVLLPKLLVPAVEAIYAFARSADDIADEGDAAPAERLADLGRYEWQLELIERGRTPDDPMFGRLAEVIAQYQLSLQPFRDLLSAFKQDVNTKEYANFELLLDYCRRSANPVGFLMLSLYGTATPAKVVQSNAICSALQLINFLQDVAIDRQKQRIYLPRDDMARFGVTVEQLDAGTVNAPFKALMFFELTRARNLMLSGAPLALHLPGRIGWELRMVVQGGLRILELLERTGFDVYRRRPKLGKRDWVVIMWRALAMRG